MSFLDLLLGKPLASDQARAESLGPVAGIPIFGLDALSSAAYGPEAALTLLLPLGALATAYMVPSARPSSFCLPSFIFLIDKQSKPIPAAEAPTRWRARIWEPALAFWPQPLS